MRALALIALLLAAQPAQPATWERWQHVTGIVDVVGPRSDGQLVAVAAGRLLLVARDGTTTPFAQGPDGFAGSPDAEPYLVITPDLPVDSAGCSFAHDELYLLDLTSLPGIARVDPAGHASRFASIPEAETLGGIALDTTGRFGHRLLVTGTRQGRTVVAAIDCQGGVTRLTDSAPPVEGGLAVAPDSFGPFGGDLIAPDENSGQLWAIGPDGAARLVLKPDLPVGGDTGIESVGFVPPGFSAGAGGFAYLADRATPNNPFPGSDSILRLSAQALAAAGVQDGDLLVATEGGGTTVAIQCRDICTARTVAIGPAGGNVGHIEGRITLTAP